MLPSISIFSSDEPLLLMEACDRVIQQAKHLGVTEREIVDVSEKTNWDDLTANGSSLSLFSEVKLTDIRFNKLPDKKAQTGLIELLQSANQENLFLLRLPKIEKRQKSTQWFKAMTANASFQELWPPKIHELSVWLQSRAASMEIELQDDAAAMLAEQTEGNLLAAKQALDKLRLLYPNLPIDAEKMASVVTDNARYSVFLCLDEALAGNGKRAIKMLHKFKQESVAPIAILVNLTREVALCQSVSIAQFKGQSPMQALSKSYLWESKKQLIVTAVKRLPLATWQRLMMRCAFLDRMVKGQEKGDIWQEMELCLWMISGQRIWGRAG